MKRYHWQELATEQERRLTITDLHRLKDLKNIIKASEKKLKRLQQKTKGNTDEATQDKVILEASRQLEKTLESLIMFFETK
jgi:hypothetical protein